MYEHKITVQGFFSITLFITSIPDIKVCFIITQSHGWPMVSRMWPMGFRNAGHLLPSRYQSWNVEEMQHAWKHCAGSGVAIRPHFGRLAVLWSLLHQDWNKFGAKNWMQFLIEDGSSLAKVEFLSCLGEILVLYLLVLKASDSTVIPRVRAMDRAVVSWNEQTTLALCTYKARLVFRILALLHLG